MITQKNSPGTSAILAKNYMDVDRSFFGGVIYHGVLETPSAKETPAGVDDPGTV